MRRAWAARATHLLAIQQHGQIVRHLALVAHNPGKRVAASSSGACTADVCQAAVGAKQAALAPQLLQLALVAHVQAGRAWAAAEAAGRRAARRHIEMGRRLERLQRRRADWLDGELVGRRLTALWRWCRVLGRGEVRGRLGRRR